jgi:peptidoglycan hydrolase-like protein with peptidoglycan-binding domain
MPSYHSNARSRLMAGALVPLLLAGCMTSPQEAPVVAQPKSRAVQNVTSFSESLRCMDNLLAQFGRRNIVITSAGIPDATANVSAGTKDMLISAISRMSVASNAFTFVDFDQRQVDVHDLQSLVGFTDDFLVPNYYIRGAITQLDEGVLSEQAGAGFAFDNVGVGASADQVVSVVSVDMNVGNLVTRQIIPGISANNSMAVARSGRAGDLSGNIQKFGFNLNVSLNRGEGMHQAVRTLVELSTIEVLGKLAQVPYWRCLQIEQTNPAVVAEARDWFRYMSPREQVVFTQQALASRGYYDAPITGVHDEATKGAIARYQADNGLLADGRVDFDLYASLINQDLALGQQPDPTFGRTPQQVAADIRPNPLVLTVATPQGSSPTYRVNQELDMTVIASQDAYLYCYYTDASGKVARIFPNQFQPDPYVIAGRSLSIPGQQSGFDIVFDRPGANEQIVCVASRKELGLRLPQQLKTQDLTPMPVQSVDEVVAAFREIDRSDVVEARLPIRVTN